MTSLIHTSSHYFNPVSMVTWLECTDAIDDHFTGRQRMYLKDGRVLCEGGGDEGGLQQPGSFKVPQRVLPCVSFRPLTRAR